MTHKSLAPEELFCTSLPNLPRAWDSVMFGLLKECPRKFQYVILMGWQPSGFAAHLEFGIAYHSALEHYDRDIAVGYKHQEATIRALRFCLSYGKRDAEGRFIPYDSAFTREPTKTRKSLARTVVWYLEHFKDDPLKTYIRADGQPAVELSFKINLELDTPDGNPFLLSGHIDRVVELNNDHLYYQDRKTTKGQVNIRYWNTFTPNNQMSIYHTATQVILNKPAKGGIIDAAQIGVGFSRFFRHTITRTPGMQAEWIKDLYSWLTLATHYANEDYWPMNDKSCSNYGGCPFQIVCSRDPKVRDVFLENEGYVKREWNPLISR